MFLAYTLSSGGSVVQSVDAFCSSASEVSSSFSAGFISVDEAVGDDDEEEEEEEEVFSVCVDGLFSVVVERDFDSGGAAAG